MKRYILTYKAVLDGFAKLRLATVSFFFLSFLPSVSLYVRPSVCLSVRPSARMDKLGSHWMDFYKI
jgi:hypothetical protein